ncbi:predicted protein [Chaetomium globosum CBS 148.51]|uniref:Uncharacterized protein n=1 Tax=Chaetomium globosum (strain ATCC 6205 / CBS 148.51 / DSM 1962 / NBRC 6347 / NRRL 1970) TaxID=306901 RepID=Q2HGS6_CHAGB|nr:uncharacterized protein CHGG_00578 [Chaetomium globosum CBS 148.51]EAQ92343.1 predicted protein [Chaetomium globosum CBS 148.51]
MSLRAAPGRRISRLEGPFIHQCGRDRASADALPDILARPRTHDAQETEPGEQKGEPNPPLVSARGRTTTHGAGFGGRAAKQSCCTPAFHHHHHPCPATHLQSGLRCMEGFLGRGFQGSRYWGGGGGEGLGHAAQHARRAAVDQISYPSEIALT